MPGGAHRCTRSCRVMDRGGISDGGDQGRAGAAAGTDRTAAGTAAAAAWARRALRGAVGTPPARRAHPLLQLLLSRLRGVPERVRSSQAH